MSKNNYSPTFEPNHGLFEKANKLDSESCNNLQLDFIQENNMKNPLNQK